MGGASSGAGPGATRVAATVSLRSASRRRDGTSFDAACVATLTHLDGATHRLGAGAAAFVPRGTAHTFASGPGEPVRFLTVHTPGGFEQMHRDICRAEREAGRAFGPAEIMPIAARHDWSFAGPPLLPSGELAPVPGARGLAGGS